MAKTKELDKVQPEKVTLMIHGKEREIKFGFSAWAKLEKEFDGLKNLDKLQKKIENEPFSSIPHLMYIGLVDKDGVSEENILDEYGLADIEMITEKFTKALYGSLPEETKKAVVEAKTK
jgi:hypothetical protein